MRNPEPGTTFNHQQPLAAQTPAPLEEPFDPEPEPALPKNNLIRTALLNFLSKDNGQRETGVSLSHHEAHCSICKHPDRDAIEQCFLHWERPSMIAYNFQIGDRRVVYRHARAFRLYEERASRSRRTLEFIMEQAETVPATADTLIRAVRAHACLGEDGRWTEPSKRLLVAHEYADPSSDRHPEPSIEIEESVP
ncbi:MAG TPA: hypothetical protein VJR26_09710 [Candidatus Acidoferrales bacterium]|nr:hypothetical protein [Candidatus Acidoferrales bacterium]